MKLLLLFLSFSFAQTRVAVIDTGYDIFNHDLTLCNTGYNFTNSESMFDYNGHGNNIIHIIENEIKDKKSFCLIPVKIDLYNAIETEIAALKHLQKEKIDVINISWSGKYMDNEEKKLLQSFLDKGVKIVVAAGNNKLDLNKKHCDVFPACYDDRIIVVGNGKGREPTEYSNYGERINFYRDGVKVKAGGVIRTGSSQSAAKYTGEYVKSKTTKRN